MTALPLSEVLRPGDLANIRELVAGDCGGLVRAFKRDDELGRFSTPTPDSGRGR